MDSVAIRSVRQETVAGAIFNRGQKGHYFRISIPDIAPPPLCVPVSLWIRILHYTVQLSPGHLDYVRGVGGFGYPGVGTTETILRGVGNIQKIITS